ncbi:MAG: peptidyl-dipeptidase A [Myxococcota bacterium]|jgi:peptidyl-dipeptidase A
MTMEIVQDLELRIESLCRRLAHAQWIQLTQGDASGVTALDDERGGIYGDAQTLAALQAMPDSPADTALNRRRDMVTREMLREAVRADPSIANEATRIASKMASARTHLEGAAVGDAEIQEILEQDPSPIRREAAWRARVNGSTALAADLVALARRRDDRARALGFDGYYALGLVVADIPDLDRLLDELAEAVGRPAQSRAPWDLTYALSAPPTDPLPAQRAVACALETFESMGLSLAGVTLDLEAREGKSEHAWCVPVSPPSDIRVSAVVTRDGPSAWETLLHELGHAAHAVHVSGPHFLLRDAPNDATHEGLAQLFASLVWEPAWLQDVAGLDATTAETMAAYGRRRRQGAMRWWLLRARVEEALLRGDDPTEAYWGLAEQLVGVDVDAQTRTLPAWSRWPHLATHPVYLQNYPVADLVAAQVAQTLSQRFGHWWRSKEAGAHLRDNFIGPGANRGMDALVRATTGQRLSAKAYAANWLPAKTAG